MNHDDLERQLRSQSGPREQGYHPTPLPAEPGAPARRRGVPPVLRGGLFAAVASAAVLAVVIVSGGLDGQLGVGGGVATPSPSDAKTQEATPSVAPSTTAEPGACRPEAVVLTAEPWGGAAGSRGTSVTLTLADGAAPCHPANAVSGRILDATGATLVETEDGEWVSSCVLEAIRADGADTLAHEETHAGAAKAVAAGLPTELLWAARGLQNEPQGLYDEGRIAALALPADVRVTPLEDVNHYSAVFAPDGTAAVVDAIERRLDAAGVSGA